MCVCTVVSNSASTQSAYHSSHFYFSLRLFLMVFSPIKYLARLQLLNYNYENLNYNQEINVDRSRQHVALRITTSRRLLSNYCILAM